MATAPVTVNANLNFNSASLNAAGRQVQSAFGNINLPTQQVNAFNNSLGRITGQASEFDKSMNAATARVFAFGAAVSVINAISNAFKGLVSTTIEVDKRLTEIGSILQATGSQLNSFKNTIFDVAKNTGQSFNTVADAAAELARQGLSAEQTAKRLNAALILTRVSGLDSASSVEALTAAINGFSSAGLTAEQIVNKLIAVDTAFAVSSKDLAEGFSRAGSTAEDAGVSFDELLGLITSVQQTTARGGAVIGNAFKSIFARLSRGTVVEDLKALGVEINASQTGVQKLQALSNALQSISDPTKANAIKELAGGVYQINVVSAALKDLSSETSIFANASKTAASASNEAFQKNEDLNKSLSAQINALSQGLSKLGSNLGNLTLGPVIENLLTGANKLLDILNNTLDPEKGNKLIQGFFKGIGSFIAGPGLILVSAAFFKIFQVVAKFAKEGVSDLFKIGSQQERIKNIEGGIVSLLQQDANLRGVLLSSSTSQAQKEQAVINAIKQQNALLTQQQTLVNSIAAAAARAGVGGYTPTGGFTAGKGKKRFAAAGYAGNVSPQQAAAEISLADKHDYVAGTVKKGIAYNGKGSAIPIIWNTAEKKEDFINDKGFRSTLITPPNGFEFAANGFVPNYAGLSSLIASPSKFSNYKLLLKEGANLKGQFQKPFGTGSGQLTKEEANEALSRARKNKNEAKNIAKTKEKEQKQAFAPIGSVDNRLKINASNYGFLIPSPNFTERFNGTGRTRDGINFEMSNLDIRGPVVPTKELTGFKQQRFNIEERIKRDITRASVSYSRPISKSLGNKDVSNSEINDLLSAKGGRGGAFGAIQGAIGSAFEAAVVASVGIQDAIKEGVFFDADNKSEALDKIFFGGSSNKKKYDFKVSNSTGNIASFAKKIIGDEKLLSTEKKKRGKAAGFIPNFNSLNKGIPVSQIRAHFDKMGNPVAVTNTRDEPNGLKDAIGRERKGIGAYTENMAANGFVPNYAAPTPKSTRSGSKDPEVSSLSTKIFAISAAISIIPSAMAPLADAFNDSSSKLKKEIEEREELTKKLEKEKSKEGGGNQAVLASIQREIYARESNIQSINNFSSNISSIISSLSTATGVGFTAISSLGDSLKKQIDFKSVTKEQAKAKGLTQEQVGIINRRREKRAFTNLSGVGKAGALAKGAGIIGTGLATGVAAGQALSPYVAKSAEVFNRTELAIAENIKAAQGFSLIAQQRKLKDLEFNKQNLQKNRQQLGDKVATRRINTLGNQTVFDRAGSSGIINQNKQLKLFSNIENEASNLVDSFEQGKGQKSLATQLSKVDKNFGKQNKDLIRQTNSDQKVLNSTFKTEITNLADQFLQTGLIPKEGESKRSELGTLSLNGVISNLENLQNIDASDPDFAKKQKEALDAASLSIGGLKTRLKDSSLSEEEKKQSEDLIDKLKQTQEQYASDQTQLNNNVIEEQAKLDLQRITSEKAVLDNFISNFNATFAQNISGIKNALQRSGERAIGVDVATAKQAAIGKGSAFNVQGGNAGEIIKARYDQIESINETFSSANLELGGNRDAIFRSDLANQIALGGPVTAIQSVIDDALKGPTQAQIAGGAAEANKFLDQIINTQGEDQVTKDRAAQLKQSLAEGGATPDEIKSAFAIQGLKDEGLQDQQKKLVEAGDRTFTDGGLEVRDLDAGRQLAEKFLNDVQQQAIQAGDYALVQKTQNLQYDLQRGGADRDEVTASLGLDLTKTQLSKEQQLALGQTQIEAIGGIKQSDKVLSGEVPEAVKRNQELQDAAQTLQKKFQGLSDAIPTDFVTNFPQVTTSFITNFSKVDTAIADITKKMEEVKKQIETTKEAIVESDKKINALNAENFWDKLSRVVSGANTNTQAQGAGL